jgi:signal transduction histidine kinase
MAEEGGGRPEEAVRSGRADATPTDELFDLAAHDIKNALNVVDSALDLIAEDPAEMTDMLPLLRRSSGRIGRLVATLVEVNRLLGGTTPVRLTEEPWAPIREAAMAQVALVAQAKAITFDRGDDRPLVVRCDRPLLERVLTNLLDHALAASPRGAVVDVHAARRPDGGFCALVGNRGAAIPPDVLPTLLRQTAARDEDVLKRFAGWGLGVVFCRLAMDRQGGSIRPISPYAGGEGMAFEIQL